MRHNIEKYKEVLLEYMEKVRKNLPKQFPTFKDFLKKMIDLANCEKIPKLGKHMVVFRLTINMRQSKLTQIALSSLFKMVSLGFIDGRVIDTSQEFYTQDFAELFTDTKTNQNEKRTIMDALIDSVNSCLFDKDEIIIQSLKLLVAFVLNPFCNVTPQSLTKIIKTIIYSFTRSRTPSIDRTAKNMLYQIINYTFQAVEGEVFTIQKNKRRLSIKEDAVQKLSQLVMLQLVDMVSLNQQKLCMINTPQILNEKQQPAGHFGYCIICRNKADFYCKDYRVPVCSYYCKKSHYEQIESAQQTFNGAAKQFEENLECALQLYDSLCHLLQSKTNTPIQIQPKNQQVILECLLYILETPDFVLSKNSKFIKVTRDKLCNHLLKYCLEIEKVLFQYSFRIFQRLVFMMRKNLKHEISIFINQIYLNILLSSNSTLLHKQTAIEGLCAILERPKTGLEFYMNYDCHTKHECIILNIVNTLNEIIVNSIYSKVEYQIQPQQENNLKQYAIKALFHIIEGLNFVFENFIQPVQEELGSPGYEEQQSVCENFTPISQNPIEQQRQLKQEIMKGVQIFKKNPEKGIKYLIKADIVQNTSKEIAKFFKENQTLIGKDAIGAYLGGHQEINVQVLSDFADMHTFKDLTVEQALRHFLDQFTLPGEAMQVDRVVQKFSDRFYKENSNSIFKSSSSIYTYCYLLVMLQTDLHNPNVVEKMKLTDFQKLARQINEGDDLPPDYLTQTYNSILKKPLAMRETEKKRIYQSDSLTQSIRKKQDLFLKEKEALLKQGNELIRNKSDPQENVYQVINPELAYLIKPLLESIGQPLFNMFLNYFERDQTEQSSNQCILGLVLFIKLCSFFSIPLQDYMNALIKATKLNKLSQIQIKHTNLIKQILQTVPLIGNGLKENGWRSIITMISRLEEVRIIKQSKDISDVQIIGVLPDLALDSDLVDKIFVQTKSLDDEAIQELITALCEISKQEIYQSSPRLYCLQKLVEVCDYNMQRVNFEWTKMWNKVRDHINEAAIKEKQVAIFTVDSLKQLSIKFLEKGESIDLQFQREVLKPFETIYIQTDHDVKEFILSCLNLIVLNHKQRIRSGWRVIFQIITLGLKEENIKISQTAYKILQHIMKQDLDLLKDVWTDIIQTLKVLAGKNSEDMALASIEITVDCFDYLSKQAKIFPKTDWDGQNEVEATVRNAQTVVQLEQFWIPLLGTLSQLAGDKRPIIQEKSIEILFSILQKFGYAFSVEIWKMIFSSVLRPIFDEIQFTFQQNSNNESKNDKWFKESCKKGFNAIITLMKRYFGKLRNLLPEFLRLFENCIQNQNVQLARYSIESLKQMIVKIGNLFNEEEWDEIFTCLDRMIKSTTPQKLVNFANQSLSASRIKNMQEEQFSHCSAQLLIILTSIDILEMFNSKITFKQYSFLQETFTFSFNFSVSFNEQIELRYAFWKQGVMQGMNFLPGLLKQEREAYGCLVIIQKYIYQNYKQLQISVLTKPIEDFIFKNQTLRQTPIITTATARDDYEQEILKLKQLEINRECQMYRQMLDIYVIPTLLFLKDEELKQNNESLFKLLLVCLSYASDVIACKECTKCQKCQQAEKSNLDEKIQKLLQRLYELK